MSFTKRTTTCPSAAITATPQLRSAETIANNDDLLNEILLRLPIKSLLKFKSVSKHWLSLISDPNFSLHRNPDFPTSASGLFLARSSRSIISVSEFDYVNLDDLIPNSSKSPFRSLAFADGGHAATGIIQSCNGLLLCSSIRALEPQENFVFNPTTKQFTKLPPISPVGDGAHRRVFGLSLAFDPSISPHYKVVCVRNSDARGDQYQIDIYSSETRCWRLSGDSFFIDSSDIRFDGGLYWNGSVHWISVWEASVHFKVEEERISPLPMPPIPEDGWDHDRKYRYFGESRGHLHLIDHIYDLQLPRFDVLEMETDYSGWSVKFRVDLSDIPSAFPQIVRRKLLHRAKLHDYVFSVLCVVRSEVDEESYLVLQIPGKVISLEIFDHVEFDKWVEKAIAPAIEPSLKLYEQVLSLGFKVFLLTGRAERHRKATVENLINVGFQYWDKLILRGPDDHGKLAVLYKSEKRSEMEREGYRILGNSGDQWSDLLGTPMSTRSFKLPNPMYYIA